MNLRDYGKQIKNKLEGLNDNIERFSEKEFQIQCTDVLLNNNLKAFMEYPFPSNKDECDIVITNKNDCSQEDTWIEIKPIWPYPHSSYWLPSKFVKEAPFKHDIKKLFNVSKNSNAWFVVILFSKDKGLICNYSKPKPKIRLSANQIVSIISKWAKEDPVSIKSFKASRNYCHIICWDVKSFEDIKFNSF